MAKVRLSGSASTFVAAPLVAAVRTAVMHSASTIATSAPVRLSNSGTIPWLVPAFLASGPANTMALTPHSPCCWLSAAIKANLFPFCWGIMLRCSMDVAPADTSCSVCSIAAMHASMVSSCSASLRLMIRVLLIGTLSFRCRQRRLV